MLMRSSRVCKEMVNLAIVLKGHLLKNLRAKPFLWRYLSLIIMWIMWIIGDLRYFSEDGRDFRHVKLPSVNWSFWKLLLVNVFLFRCLINLLWRQFLNHNEKDLNYIFCWISEIQKSVLLIWKIVHGRCLTFCLSIWFGLYIDVKIPGNN